jgi:RNA polymerase sigma-B factor
VIVASIDQRALLVAYLREGDVHARDRLVEDLMPLVRSLAHRYTGRGEPTDDLVQVGAIGLVKAIDRFDLDKGVELSTYAVPTIVGEIRRHFRDRTWVVHVPRRLKELSMRLSRTRDELSAELGRSPTVSELADAAGVDEEEAIDALEASKAYAPRSLDQPYDDDEPGRLPGLADEELGYVALERGSVVRQGLDALEERERKIVVLRFLQGMSQSEIAAEVGISQMHVSRLLRKALETMRGRLEEPEVTA